MYAGRLRCSVRSLYCGRDEFLHLSDGEGEVDRTVWHAAPHAAVLIRSSGRIALTYPQDASAGVSSFLFAHYFRFQTDRTEVGFRNQRVEYAIFDYTEDGRRRAGVRVTTADGKETELLCSGPITSRLAELKAVLRCDADNALNGGSCR